ncbi:hypothetical protein BJV38_000285 [Clostridium beijerinckii]|uniref:Uncharacterized protein n=1 Tax=Clostridium beijerinckii TaxID=1520 RepID=A0AAX0B7V5_CLOBE|nr:hypothetical protein [Clostridium beijerinckii]NRT43442.1 hypothetical protein [Clostridium beijerinckii]NRT91303.1 hypothetical protein [Clostridium beijerinckii]NRZ22567.1 hypothetical protein [Clostridium beijerinckii]NYC70828.1 hypothetical protein [Clostridium beijerinckii]
MLAYYMTHGVNKKRLGSKLGIIGAILVLVVGISNSFNYINDRKLSSNIHGK